MPRRRIYAAPLLALILVCLQVGPARPGILEKASQLISLVATQDNPINLSNFRRRLPTGETVAYTLPPNTVFVLTKLSWNFTATNTALNGDVLFTVGNYYRFRVTMTNGYCGASDGTTLGVPITNMGQPVKVSLFGDAAQTFIPGTLSIRLVGYTAPNQ
jgi:hypothetical protein